MSSTKFSVVVLLVVYVHRKKVEYEIKIIVYRTYRCKIGNIKTMKNRREAFGLRLNIRIVEMK